MPQGDWEVFQLELAELAKAAPPDPALAQEAENAEASWRGFTEACDLRSVGVQVHERLRSERNTEPDGIAKSADRKKAAARTYLQRRLAAGESAEQVIAACGASPSTQQVLREIAAER